MRLKIILTSLFVLLLLDINYSEDDRRDGNWWNQQSHTTKGSYITGIFDGIQIGNNFSITEIMDKNPECLKKVNKSYMNCFELLKNKTNAQFVDGLDTIYQDYKNRSLKISYAFWVVLYSMNGKSEKEIQIMIESARKIIDD
jgi:hypothetical protein